MSCCNETGEAGALVAVSVWGPGELRWRQSLSKPLKGGGGFPDVRAAAGGQV